MLLALLLALQIAAPTAEAERLFALGQTLFDEGDAAGAVAAFEGVATMGWTAGALEHNWGTACLATEDLGCAVLHLERARRLLPHDEAVAHNLVLAHRRAGVALSTPSPLDTVRDTLGLTGLLGLALALWIGALALVGFRLWTRRGGVAMRRAMVGLVALAAIVLGLGVWAWSEARMPSAVVVTEATLHRTPGGGAGEGLGPGHVLRVLERQGDWVEVRTERTSGWLPARAVVAI